MAVGIRSQKYRDPVGRSRRNRKWFWRAIIMLLLVGAVGGAVWKLRTLHIHFAPAATITKPLVAVGTWCQQDRCQFFDRSGTRWGTALHSSGPLLLLIDDTRSSSSYDPTLTVNLLAMADGLPKLGLAARSMAMSDDQPGVTISTTKGYDLYVDGLGDSADQLNTLSVFLADRANPPAGGPAFAPQYIDLRTPGRVYYK